MGIGESGSGDLVAGLRELTALVLSTGVVEEALEHVAGVANRTVPGRPGVGVTLVRDRRLETVAASTHVAPVVEEAQYRRGEGPCLEACREGTHVEVLDMATETRWGDLTDYYLKHDVASAYCVPVKASGESAGALNLYFGRPGRLSAEGRTIAEVIADMAGLLLASVERHASYTQLSEQLRQALASRAVIDQAIGIIIAHEGVSGDEAFEILRGTSQRQNRKVRDIAASLVEETGGAPVRLGEFREH